MSPPVANIITGLGMPGLPSLSYSFQSLRVTNLRGESGRQTIETCPRILAAGTVKGID